MINRRELSSIKTNLNILIVEDDNPTMYLMSCLLKAFKNKTSEAGTAEDGLRFVEAAHKKNEPYDLIYLDINLPNMNGLELCKKLREDSRNNKALIVMTTTESNLNTIIEAIESGADDYMIKPATPTIIAIKTIVCQNRLKKFNDQK